MNHITEQSGRRLPFLENHHLIIELKEMRTLDNTTNFGISKLSQFDEFLHNFEKTADTVRSRRLNLSIDWRFLSEGIIKDTASAELKQPETNRNKGSIEPKLLI